MARGRGPGRCYRAAIACVAAATVLVAGAEAYAEPTHASLSVHRGVGAETCADDKDLTELIETIAGAKILSGPGDKPVHLDVSIEREGKSFKAKVDLSGERTGSRTIDDQGPGCDALSQALAVTVAVLLDAGSGETAHAPKKPKPKQAFVADEHPPAAPKEPPSPAPPLTLTAGAFYDFGTLDGSAGGMTLSLDAYVPIVSFGIAFVGLPYAPTERPNSKIVYRFLAGRTRVCTREPYLELFGASFCAGFLAGERRGEVEEESDRGAFLAAVLQLEVSRRIVGPFGIFAELGLSIPFFKEEIVVSDISLDEQPVSFQMGAGVRFWIGK